MLLGCAWALQACGASTGAVRTDLDTPGIKALRETVVKNCTGIPRPWPDTVEIDQKGVEKLVKRDERDTINCAKPSLEYVRTITKRDQGLMGTVKK